MNSSRNIRPDDVPLRSWVVIQKGNEPVLDHSRWAVGYTDAHKATPQEAIEFAVQSNIQMHEHLERQREKLLHLLALVKDTND